MKSIPSAIASPLWAALSGLALSAAFPKTGLWCLAWVALIPLLAVIRETSIRRSFVLGFVAGFSHFITLIYWLAGTMHTYGHLPWYLCLPILFVFALYLALYMGAVAAFTRGCCHRPVTVALMFPVAWVCMEYLRASLLTGFPWEMLGYSQYRVLRILQISDIVGVYGLSFLVAFGNASLFLLLVAWRRQNWQGRPVPLRHAAPIACAFLLLLCLSWTYGGMRMTAIDNLAKAAPSEKMAVIQGDIAEDLKWNPDMRLNTLERYLSLSRSALAEGPALIVWPETAVPFYFLDENRYTPLLLQAISTMPSDFLIGSPAAEVAPGTVSFRNRAYLVTPQGRILGYYDKAHLVPFGEYVPLKRWLPFVKKIVSLVGDFAPGPAGKTLPWGNHRLGVLICYDMIFPKLPRLQVQNGANCLINISNDAWYGTSSAPFQLFSMAVFRAVENRRAVVRAANTGISGFIDPCGRIMGSTPLFKTAAMTRRVPMLTVKSPYDRWGYGFAPLCVALTLTAFLAETIRRARRRKRSRR